GLRLRRDDRFVGIRGGLGDAAEVDVEVQWPDGVIESFEAVSTGARITGHRKDDHRLPNLDTAVEDGDVIEICGEPAHVMDVSGHTIGHIAYHFPQSQLAFTGDSLMGLGCGRLFEGSPEQMWDSLSKLAALPEDTVICSGHEYSAANADFALSVDSENEALKKRAAEIRAKRAENTPTIPVRLAEELCTNPFLRASDPTLKAALDLSESPDWQVFAEIRRRKDSF
ncbi:MAG: hydroxyacylglutathione hydrolase, partial [Mangrovicoccus sp.]